MSASGGNSISEVRSAPDVLVLLVAALHDSVS